MLFLIWQVIMGGGSKCFVPETVKDKNGRLGARKDSNNLIEEWLKDKADRNAMANVVYDAGEMKSLNPDNVDYLLGKFY